MSTTAEHKQIASDLVQDINFTGDIMKDDGEVLAYFIRRHIVKVADERDSARNEVNKKFAESTDIFYTLQWIGSDLAYLAKTELAASVLEDLIRLGARHKELGDEAEPITMSDLMYAIRRAFSYDNRAASNSTSVLSNLVNDFRQEAVDNLIKELIEATVYS